MNIRGSLLKSFPDNLVNELHDACLLILILINDTGLVPLLEIVIIKVSPLKNLFKGISAYPVEAPQPIMNPSARCHPPRDWYLDCLNRSLTRCDIEGVVGSDHQSAGSMLITALKFDGKNAMPQSNLWTTHLSERQRLGRRGNIFQPVKP